MQATVNPLFISNLTLLDTFGARKGRAPTIIDAAYSNNYPRTDFKGKLNKYPYKPKYLFAIVNANQIQGGPTNFKEMEDSIRTYKEISFIDPYEEISGRRQFIFTQKAVPLLLAFSLEGTDGKISVVEEEYSEEASKEPFPPNTVVRILLKRDYHAFICADPSILVLSKIFAIQDGKWVDASKKQFDMIYENGGGKISIEQVNKLISETANLK